MQLYDFGVTDDGTLYFAMELLDGLDLESLVRRKGPLPPARVIHILRQVCESLEEAHASGLVHRDIKPENILLEDGQALVADFGIARAVSAVGEGKLTSTGVSLGTPAYMSPEQGMADPNLDGRTDIYSTGCVAYFLLTGEPVFTADTPLAVVVHHVNTPPTPPSGRACPVGSAST